MAYILVFDTGASAQANLNAKIITISNQAFVVYKNLLIAAVDYDVIELVSGQVYTSE